MAFTTRTTGDVIQATDITDIHDALQGVSGAAQAISLTKLNSTTSWSLSVCNLDSTNAYAFQVLQSDGSSQLFACTVNGLTVKKSTNLVDSYADGTTRWPLQIEPTWDATSSFNAVAIYMNWTDTGGNSSGVSRFLDFQYESTTKFVICKNGRMGIGAALSDSGMVYIDHEAYTATANTNIARLLVENSNLITVPAGTTSVAASIYVAEPNLTATGTVTEAATVYIEGAPTEGTTNYALYSGAGRIGFIPTLSVVSASGAVCNAVNIPATTITVTGTTQVTTATGFNLVSIAAPTYTDASAVTIDVGATVYIGGAPTAGGSVTLTSGYALWVDAGTSRFDAGVYLGTTATAAALVSQATSGSGTTTHYIGNQTITTSSDSRVKTDIQEWQGSALELLRHAEPLKEFRYNLPGGGAQDSGYGPNARGKYLGFMAQETLKWAPWVVNAGAGADCQRCLAGLPCDEHTSFAVEYQHLVPLAITGIKELDARLRQVEQRLTLA